MRTKRARDEPGANRENGTITEGREVDAVWIIFCGFLAA